jgi:trk system potassium uptake protein
MRVVIAGCGRIGAELARLLDGEGHDITVIDRDPEAFRRLPAGFRGRALVGEVIDEDLQRQAGVDDADAFIALADGDNHNVMASQIAKHMMGVPIVISQIKDPIRQETYNLLGIETVSPTILGAERILDAIMGNSSRQ